MLKKSAMYFILNAVLFAIPLFVSAQNVSTTVTPEFRSGSTTVKASGVYSAAGGSALHPGSRYLSVSWTDAAGNGWLFGGRGYGSSGNLGDLNDLWKYDSTTRQWSWKSGSEFVNLRGKTGSTNDYPGARRGATGWMDSSGNLWLFGGRGFDVNGSWGNLSDLWKFDVGTEKWSWVRGSTEYNQSGDYTTDGSLPGGRYLASSWTDKTGNLWLFGGDGLDDIEDDTTTSGSLNDLWKYSISEGGWSWVGGSKVANQAGNYTNPDGFPGARMNGTRWTDSNGDFWLFGGNDKFGDFNDLWKYSVSSHQWTFVGGSTGYGAAGNYTSIGAAIPAARHDAAGWTDSKGNFWLFGGEVNLDAISKAYRNDLWKYSSVENQWSWVGGDQNYNKSGIYGVSGGFPGARHGAATWTDLNGDLWMMGGYGRDGNGGWGYLNDVWKLRLSETTGPVDPGSSFSLAISSNLTTEALVVGQQSDLTLTLFNNGELDTAESTFTITLPSSIFAQEEITFNPPVSGTSKIDGDNVIVSLQGVEVGQQVDVTMKIVPMKAGNEEIATSVVWGSGNSDRALATFPISVLAEPGIESDLKGEGSITKALVKTNKKGTITQLSITATMTNTVSLVVPATIAKVYLVDNPNISDVLKSNAVAEVKWGAIKNKTGKPLKVLKKKANLKIPGDAKGKFVYLVLDATSLVKETDEFNNYIRIGQIQ